MILKAASCILNNKSITGVFGVVFEG